MKFVVAGENALIIYFADKPSDQVASKIKSSVAYIKAHFADLIIELIPSYTSLFIAFDEHKIGHKQLIGQLEVSLNALPDYRNVAVKLVELPAYYGVDVGWDLKRISDKSKLSIEQVVALHQQLEYRVYAIGFAPGFAYMGHVDERIAMPRLNSPRQRVPKGAIGIADQQTAVYPNTSPGGWNIIGLCPIPMFNYTPNSNAPNSQGKIPDIMPLQVGDKVKFKAISRDEFLALGGQLHE